MRLLLGRMHPLKARPDLRSRLFNARSISFSAFRFQPLPNPPTSTHHLVPPSTIAAKPSARISRLKPTPVSPPRFTPSPRQPWGFARRLLVWGTIGTNIYIFTLWARSEGHPNAERWMRENFTLSQQNLREGRYWTIVASAFSHATLSHLAFNMFAFSFSANLAFYCGLGTTRILTLCLGSILASSTCSLLDERSRKGLGNKPGGRQVMYHHLGASGMVQGLITAMALTVPFLPVQLMFIPVDFSLWKAALGFVALDLYNLIEARKAGPKSDGRSVVGYAAHLGGAVFGALYYMLRLRYRFGGAFPPRS